MLPQDFELVGGPEAAPIVLVPPDPAWATRFAALRPGVVDALDGVAVRVEHIGSTAVPGLVAKPILDVQVGVPDPDDEAALTRRLAPLGMELRVREPRHRMYRTPARDLHLHLWVAGSDHERRHLVFRDWLRRDAADRARYAAAKTELARRPWADMNDYAQAKNDVVAAITARAEAWAAASGWAFPAPLPGAPAVSAAP